MIVSIDTIKCDRQVVLFFGQETVVIWPNDGKTHARCKTGRSGQRGSGHKA